MKTKLFKIVLAGLLSLGSAVCAAQDLTVDAGQSYTIPSAAPAENFTGNYRWLENGKVIDGATDADYTNAAGKALNGTYVYVRQAEIKDCGWQSSNAFDVAVIGGTDSIMCKPASAYPKFKIVDVEAIPLDDLDLLHPSIIYELGGQLENVISHCFTWFGYYCTLCHDPYCKSYTHIDYNDQTQYKKVLTTF
jgi:hypothetical protein